MSHPASSDADLRARLRRALTTAMRARDADTLLAVRSAIAAIDNAEAVPVEAAPAAGAIENAAVGVGAAEAQRRVVPPTEQEALVRAEIDERIAAAERLRDQPGRSAALRAGADALQRVLAGE